MGSSVFVFVFLFFCGVTYDSIHSRLDHSILAKVFFFLFSFPVVGFFFCTGGYDMQRCGNDLVMRCEVHTDTK